MEILKAIDSILSTFIMRWVLLLTASVLAITVIVLFLSNKVCQLNAAIKVNENAKLNASLDLQNSMIKQHADNMKNLQSKLNSAYNEIEKRNTIPVLTPLAGDCEHMVDKVVLDVKNSN